MKSGYWPLYRFQPSEIDDGQPFQLDSKAAGDPGARVRRHRDPLRHPRAHRPRPGRARSPSCSRPTSTSAGATTSSSRRCSAPSTRRPRRASRSWNPRWRTTPATATRARTGMTDLPPGTSGSTCAPRSWPRPARSPASRRPPRWSRTPAPARDRHALAVRGGDPRTRSSSSTAALEAGSEHFAEALDYFPDVDELPTAGDRYLANARGAQAQSSVPVIASLNATSAGGWVRYASLIEQRRRRRPRAQPVPRRRRPDAQRGGHRGRRPRHRPRGARRDRRSRSP